jgi:multidrug resistance protein
MKEYGNNSLELAGFIVSVYIFGFVAGPLVFAPLSELYGRVPVYHLCNIGFTVSVALCTVAPDVKSLIIFRFISGVFGSCPATIGGGSIADMIPQERRGRMMGAYTAGALCAPIVGPILGGVLTSAIGWRWNFYLLTIAGGACTVAMFLVLKETYHPVLLERKTQRRRDETGNDELRSKLDVGLTRGAYFVRSITRPLKMLVLSPIVIITCLSIAVTYGYICEYCQFS